MHPDNVAGKPLPWTKDQSGNTTLEGQALLDRIEKVHQGSADDTLFQDWLVELAKGGVKIVWEWEDEKAVLDTLEEMNNTAIELVQKTLLAQVSKLRPFEQDSPELKLEKQRVARQRIEIINSMSAKEIGPLDNGIMVGGVELETPGFTAHYRGKGIQFVTPNRGLQFLIQVAESGDFENLQCSDGSHHYRNLYCGKP